MSKNPERVPLDDLDRRLMEVLQADGRRPFTEIATAFEIDVRYHGQAFEVPMHVTLESLKDGGLTRLAAAFDDEHRRLFTFNMDAEHELVNLRAVAIRKADIAELDESLLSCPIVRHHKP